MQTAIAQAVALVCHGNARLRGEAVPPFFPGNSTTQFCEWIRFVEVRRRLWRGARERPLAESPDEWFARLEREGVRRARLAYEPSGPDGGPDHDTVGFAGSGGGWWILTEGAGDRAGGWRSRWSLGDREAADRRIWRVTHGFLGAAGVRPGATGLAAAAEALDRSLDRVAHFSRAHAGGAFVEAFDGARRTLETGEPRGYHRDLAPPGLLPPAAARLLEACQAAWVFGGMGWWNDQVHEGEVGREFARVTDALWTALACGIVAATNASSP